MRRQFLLGLAVLILATLLLWWGGILGPSETLRSLDSTGVNDGLVAGEEESSASQPSLACVGGEPRTESPSTVASPSPGEIRGLVRDARTGKPVTGARVEVEPDARGTAIEAEMPEPVASAGAATHTDPDGHFLCPVVTQRAWRLRITKGNYATAVTEPTQAGAVIVVDLHPVLKQRGRVIGGIPGAAVHGATVRFREAHPQTGVAGWRPPVIATATTDADGRFEVGLGQGVRYSVTVTHPAYIKLHQFFLSTSAEATFEMEGGAFLRGHVGRAMDHTPLKGAWIRFSLLGEAQGCSGADGSFLVPGSTRLLYVGAKEHATQVIDMHSHAGRLDVWLQPSRTLRGAIRAPEGQSPRGLTVEVRGNARSGAPVEIHRVMTDGQGAYSIADAGRSAAYVVLVDSHGLHGAGSMTPPVDEDDVDLGSLPLEVADLVLRGTVTGPAPPARVLLRLKPRRTETSNGDADEERLLDFFGARLAFADAEGRFSLERLAAGSYELTAKAEGWPDLKVDVALSAGVAPLDIVMKGSHEIRGRLFDAGGRPLPGYYCSVAYGPHKAHAVTDAQGRFHLHTTRAADTYVLDVRSIGVESRQILRERVGAGPEERVFVAPGSEDIQGTVALDRDHLWRGYTVEARVDGRVAATTTGDELGFVVRGVTGVVDLVARRVRADGEAAWEAEALAVSAGARNVVLQAR